MRAPTVPSIGAVMRRVAEIELGLPARPPDRAAPGSRPASRCGARDLDLLLRGDEGGAVALQLRILAAQAGVGLLLALLTCRSRSSARLR